MIEVLTDEIPGMDEALGEKGKVVFNGVTTNFQQSDGTTEFTQSSKEGELNYGKVNPETGTITYIVMSHKEGQGTYFDALTAGEGAYHGRESEGFRTGGFIAP